jgi:septum formation protein
MLILASTSPRRHELLRAAGIDHVVRPAHVTEIRRNGEAPENFVQRLAREKVQALPLPPGDTILGADTIVCLEGVVLGKPADTADAIRMLRVLAGRDHRVLTGICLRRGERTVADFAETHVWFDTLTESEIAEYVHSGEPMDKAGAYAIQGYASRFITKIDGCYQNVVGLPVSLVYRYLKTL